MSSHRVGREAYHSPLDIGTCVPDMAATVRNADKSTSRAIAIHKQHKNLQLKANNLRTYGSRPTTQGPTAQWQPKNGSRPRERATYCYSSPSDGSRDSWGKPAADARPVTYRNFRGFVGLAAPTWKEKVYKESHGKMLRCLRMQRKTRTPHRGASGLRCITRVITPTD